MEFVERLRGWLTLRIRVKKGRTCSVCPATAFHYFQAQNLEENENFVNESSLLLHENRVNADFRERKQGHDKQK